MKRKFILPVVIFVLTFLSTNFLHAQSVAINTDGTTAHASALLDIKSSTKGMLVPRMTSLQRAAIATPAVGLFVYDTDTNSYWYFNGTAWAVLSAGSSTNYWSLNGSDIYNNTTGNVGIGTIAPFAYGHGGNNRITEISNPNTGSNVQSHLILSSNGTSGSAGGITWASLNVAGTEKRLGFIGDVYETSNAARMVFYTRDEAGNLGEKLTVLGNGNVGVGTRTLIYKLHVETTGTAIYGNSTGGSGSSGAGVYGNSTYLGVYGVGGLYGVYGKGGPYGVFGSGTSYGVYGTSSSGPGINGTSGSGNGVSGSSDAGYGVFGQGGPYGVYGSGNANGVRGVSANTGVYGNGNSTGVWGVSNNEGVLGIGTTVGVKGDGNSFGVFGSSTGGEGVHGESSNYRGGNFYSATGNALWAKTGTPNTAGIYAGVFEGSLYSYGSYQASDKNLKKNIQDVGDAMSIINKLKPKNYEFRNDGKYAAMNLPKGNHYRLIAQELEEVLPNLVAYAPHGLGATTTKPDVGKTSPEAVAGKQQNKISEIPDTKAINYTELIPILIKGMQEQQQQINLLLKRIEALEKK